MTQLVRTDVHRPSAINPADYNFVAFDYLADVQGEDPREAADLANCTWLTQQRGHIALHMQGTGGTWSTHSHGGNCMVCGNANALYTACFHHIPSNSYVRMGSDCAQHARAALSQEDFRRFRDRINAWRRSLSNIEAARGALIAHQLGDLLWALSEHDYQMNTPQGVVCDIVGKLARWGSLTERQWAYLARLRDQIANPAQVQHTTLINQYAGPCSQCRQTVEPRQGYLVRVDGRWTVRHNECPPAPAPVNTNVGELSGIMQLFDRARQHLQRPAVVLNVPGHGDIRITVAGERSRTPGSLFVTLERVREYLGRVDLGGNFLPTRLLSPGHRAAVQQRLQQFAVNPAQVAAEYGRLAGRCCFCRLPLTDERSTAVGYGPICAGHYGLPWGDRPAEFAAPVAATGGVVERQRTTIAQAMIASTGLSRQRQPVVPACPGCESEREVVAHGDHFKCIGCNIEFSNGAPQ